MALNLSALDISLVEAQIDNNESMPSLDFFKFLCAKYPAPKHFKNPVDAQGNADAAALAQSNKELRYMLRKYVCYDYSFTNAFSFGEESKTEVTLDMTNQMSQINDYEGETYKLNPYVSQRLSKIEMLCTSLLFDVSMTIIFVMMLFYKDICFKEANNIPVEHAEFRNSNTILRLLRTYTVNVMNTIHNRRYLLLFLYRRRGGNDVLGTAKTRDLMLSIFAECLDWLPCGFISGDEEEYGEECANHPDFDHDYEALCFFQDNIQKHLYHEVKMTIFRKFYHLGVPMLTGEQIKEYTPDPEYLYFINSQEIKLMGHDLDGKMLLPDIPQTLQDEDEEDEEGPEQMEMD